ncbi:YybS family protein [Clostridium aestuarii]|uniref:YybS family protein n=1 Tax=Clostridium aestuarii TaxID=338193 RepID=A0ABT4D274_9CLOT|nr:YybS family protein [Clostridium aestuarii]MCY6485351.1 YybS family protein [Clostridium aestuarii]
MQSNGIKVKALVEIAIMVAIISVVILYTAYVPFLAGIGMFILPIPITLLYVRHDYKSALSAIFVGTILTAFIYSPILAITSAIMYGITGISLGYCIRNRKKSSSTIVGVAIAIVIGNIIQFLVYALFINKQGIVGSINNIVDTTSEAFKMALDTYLSMGITEEQIAPIKEGMKLITAKNVISIIPTIILVSSLIQAYIQYIITEKVFIKLKYSVDKVTPFSRLYIPNLVAAVLIGILCSGILLDTRGIEIGSYITETTKYILLFVFELDGIAFFIFVLRNKLKFSKGVAMFIIIIGFALPILSGMYSIAGAMDIILNLRRLDPNPIRKIK